MYVENILENCDGMILFCNLWANIGAPRRVQSFIKK